MKMKRPLCFICLAFVITIYCYMEWNPLPAFDIASYAGRQTQIQGQLEQKEYKNQQYILYINHVTFCDTEISKQNNQQEEYQFICYFEEGTVDIEQLKIGMHMQIQGKLKPFAKATNPGEFDAARYYHILGYEGRLEESKILAITKSFDYRREMLYQSKMYLASQYDHYLEPKEASIMKAMVLGDKQELDRESKNLYQRAGISHILAISGLHITLIGMAIYWLLRKIKLPMTVAVGLSVVMMIQFGEMTGMGSSVNRAIFMFGVRLCSQCIKRSYDMLTAMLLSCMLLLLEQPMYIYHGGFLLSFGAILGIGLMGPVFSKPYKRKKHFLRRHIQQAIASLQSSISIFAIHFPILISQYYVFPIYSFLLNLFIIPMMGIVLALGIALVITGICVPPFAFVCAGLLRGCLWLFEVCARFSVALPGGIWTVGKPVTGQIIVYIGVLLILYLGAEKIPLWLRYAWLLAAVLVISMPIPQNLIAMLDVGQGDGIYIETDTGHHYMIDGGSTSNTKLAEYQLIPFLQCQGVDRLDAVFITHLDTDHIAGIQDMLMMQQEENIRIERIVLAKAVVKDDAYTEFMRLCEEQQVAVTFMEKGDCIEDGNMTITCLFPEKEYQTDDRNNASLVLDVTIGNFSGLFTGDVGEEGEGKIVRMLQDQEFSKTYQIFKSSHHGSKYSNTETLLKQIKPKITLISCGEKNRYGHPHQETIERLEEVESEIYQTQESGAILIRFYKDYIKIQPFIQRE